MEYKVALIVDWENVRKRVFGNKNLLKLCYLSYNQSPEKIPQFFLGFLNHQEEIPYRLFFYTAEPFKGIKKKPDGSQEDFSNSPVTRKSEEFIKKVSLCELTAIRKGRLAFRGWDSHGKPIFVQKKVDMLIGLDIAHLAYKRLVDRIMVFSYDLDIQPALRVARLEGLQVVLPILEELGTDAIPKELIEHSDFIRIKSFKSLCEALSASVSP